MEEELPTNNFMMNCIAGTTAGILEYCLFFPLDTIKTRMQDLSKSGQKFYGTFLGALYYIIKNEGILAPYKGLGITAIGSGPAHGVYFAVYEYSRDICSRYIDPHYAYGLAGVNATVVHDLIIIPTETIKQRMQMHDSPYKTITECIITILKKEGPRAFYRSYMTQLLMNIPFQSVHFTVYEITNNLINPEKKYHPLSHVLSGGLAGAVGAAVTTPLDVCKTLLNTQKHSKRVIGVKNAILTVYKEAGLSGFFRGVTARVLFIMPSTAVCWGVYESMKSILVKTGKTDGA